MRVLFIQHDHRNPPGLLADVFAARGYEATVFPVVPERCGQERSVGVRFPDPAGFDVVVPLGCDWSEGDPRVHTWLVPELMMLRGAHQAGIPVLGVCFGAQLLARALGGLVRPAPYPEIGWRRMAHWRGAGAREAGGWWFEWHHDQLIPPPGAVTLAHTGAGAQVFTLGPSWGVQFHPEADGRLVRAWLAGDGAAEARMAGVNPQALIAETERYADCSRSRADALAGRFLAGSSAGRAPLTYAG